MRPASQGAPGGAAWIDRHAALVAVALVAANLALKLPGLEAQGLWFDEAVSIQNARQPIDLARRMASDASPPLYGVLLSLWMDAFGTSLAAARSLSAVLSSATAAVLFALGRRFAGAEVGLVAAALFTGARIQVFHAHEARPYALVGLLCAGSFLAFLALLRRPARGTAAALALLNAALVYAHTLAALACAAQLAAAIVAGRAQPRALRLTLASLAATAVIFLPFVVWTAAHWPPPMSGWAAPPTPERLLTLLEVFAGSRVLLGLIAALCAVALWRRLRAAAAAPIRGSADAEGETSFLRVVLLWLLLPILVSYAVSQIVPVFLQRYLLFSSLALYLLTGWAVSRLPLPGAARATAALALVALSLAALRGLPIVRPDWRGAAEAVRAARTPGAAVVVSPPFQVLPFAFHFAPAAFADPQRMAGELAAEGVAGARLEEAVEMAPRVAADRLVFAVSEETSPLPVDVVPRLDAAGFALVEERRLNRVVVLVFDRR